MRRAWRLQHRINMAHNNIAEMRKTYDGTVDSLNISNLASKDPYLCFKSWFQLACETKCIGEPNAMMLATATKDGKPSSRVVLLKDFTDKGFHWFTNYNSRKGQELEENPFASLLFYWCNMNSSDGQHWSRQVRIEGKVEKLPPEQSTQYFQQRPKGSQIGATVSQQSTVIPSRKVLDDKASELEEQYKDQEVLPKPDFWGGYLLTPHRFEFWQGVTNRLHDRLLFRKPDGNESIDPELTHAGENGWVIERLSP